MSSCVCSEANFLRFGFSLEGPNVVLELRWDEWIDVAGDGRSPLIDMESLSPANLRCTSIPTVPTITPCATIELPHV